MESSISIDPRSAFARAGAAVHAWRAERPSPGRHDCCGPAAPHPHGPGGMPPAVSPDDPRAVPPAQRATPAALLESIIQRMGGGVICAAKGTYVNISV